MTDSSSEPQPPTLPLVSPGPREIPRRRGRGILMHASRVLVLAAIVWLIHDAHAARTRRAALAGASVVDPETVRRAVPSAARVENVDGRTLAVDADGDPLAIVLTTSPESDHITGFSGPTNVLLVLDLENVITHVEILSSGDTREHVEQVRKERRFLERYVSRTWEEVSAGLPVDAVSGATLTSLAIAQSIAHRLGGRPGSLKFPDPPAIEVMRELFPDAVAVVADEHSPHLWHVLDSRSDTIGRLLRTTPAAENVVGYQGPTEALIAVEAEPDVPGEGVLGRLAIGKSYDNQPYVGYLPYEEYFLTFFEGKTFEELSGEYDLRSSGMEGVSGATMTSMAVAEGVLVTVAAQREAERQPRTQETADRFEWLTGRTIGTAGVTLFGIVLGLTSLRGIRWLRIGFQLVLIVYLGFINADLVSQALLVGWSQNGIPWKQMAGPAVLVAGALLLPIVSGSNVYCSHICPFGAMQQLLRKRVPWRWHLRGAVERVLRWIPGLLLLWVVVVAVTSSAHRLVSIEPFDAFVPRIAGWAALAIALVGLAAALVIPMAYCRYGCPTGALLGWLRRHSRSDEVTARDGLAIVALLVAVCLRWFSG